MIAGPYRAGAVTNEQRATNLRVLNAAAVEVFRRGHVPIIGVNMALPMIEAAGQEHYESIMMPISLALCERCDAILRVPGESGGADAEVEKFRAVGKPVYFAIDEVPRMHNGR